MSESEQKPAPLENPNHTLGFPACPACGSLAPEAAGAQGEPGPVVSCFCCGACGAMVAVTGEPVMEYRARLLRFGGEGPASAAPTPRPSGPKPSGPVGPDTGDAPAGAGFETISAEMAPEVAAE